MRPRIFLRTTEFLWQEGHTAHASEEEARQETLKMLEVYRSFMEDVLAMPVIVGEKSPGEKFPGAQNTYCLEAMMQDRKALQAGTSHYLGQNFAKASNIRFSNKEGALEYAYTTSWGVTTRLIGSLIMCHSDDDGLRLPPRIAPKQIVIIPVIPKPELEAEVLAYAERLAASLRECRFCNKPISVYIDKRDKRGGEKNWEWIKKGVPLRIEVGPRDIESGVVMLSRRDQPPKQKQVTPLKQLLSEVASILQEIQNRYHEQACHYRDQHLYKHIENFEQLKQFFTPKNEEKPEIHGGFVLAKWCGDPATEEMLSDLKVTIRCLPIKQSGTKGRCVLTGREATLDAVFAKSY
jgi:prolyl-tRNA synthetase